MSDTRTPSRVRDERGIALVLSLFIMLALASVAASLMFLSQTETYSSMNYRLMSQARYGAESGIQKAANYLLYTYVEPSTGGADSIASYVTTVSPVTYNGQPVVVSANADMASNYPVAAVQTAFSNAVHGTLASGTTPVDYAPYATLLSMEEIPAASSTDGLAHTIQTWQITSVGSVTAGTRKAEVEVTATLDTQKISTSSQSLLKYAAFATAATCGALQFSGGAQTKSFDSHASGFNPAATVSATNGGLQTNCSASGADPLTCNKGSVGTNGNLTESGGAAINGTLSTPRIGVGSCSSGNVNAETTSGGATVTGGLVQLPQAVSIAPPAVTNPGPPTSNLSVTSTTTCAALGLSSPASCSGTNAGTGTGLTVTPNGATINWGNLSISGGGKLVINDGTYNLNSVSVSGGGSITTDAAPDTTINMTVVRTFSLSGGATFNIPATGSTVALNMVDTASVTTPVDFSGGSVSNGSMDASKFQIKYGGTGSIKLSGGTKQAAVVYAPNAAISFSGGSALYGAVIGKTIIDSGGAHIFYDRNLQSSGLFTTTTWQAGNSMLSSFSWKKY